jgi:hypothetical protein
MCSIMVKVLLIEVQAFHTFAWAEDWLADPHLVAGEGRAAELVSHIRADETPHVGYLRTALTEMRDRTWIGASGKRHSGAQMVGTIWDLALGESLGAGKAASRKAILGEVEHWCLRRSDGKDLLAQFHALA